MLKIESSVVINRPLEDVFAVLSNVENNPKWSSVFLEAEKTSAGPIGVGTTWRIVGRAFGQGIEAEVEVTEYEPNRKWAQKQSGPISAKIRQTYKPVEEGTRVNVALEGELGGFFKLAEPLLKTMMKRGIENDLATVKDLMEAHAL